MRGYIYNIVFAIQTAALFNYFIVALSFHLHIRVPISLLVSVFLRYWHTLPAYIYINIPFRARVFGFDLHIIHHLQLWLYTHAHALTLRRILHIYVWVYVCVRDHSSGSKRSLHAHSRRARWWRRRCRTRARELIDCARDAADKQGWSAGGRRPRPLLERFHLPTTLRGRVGADVVVVVCRLQPPTPPAAGYDLRWGCVRA